MTQEQLMVQEFMNTFGQEVKKKPEIPSLEVRKLRAKLILEEALECVEALGFKYLGGGNPADNYMAIASIIKPNMELIADGLADLHYVAYCGTALACGLDMETIFEEVHRSNMSKLWSEEDRLRLTSQEIDQYTWTRMDDESEQHGFILYLVKNKDGKVIKSPSYSPVNIAKIINDQSS